MESYDDVVVRTETTPAAFTYSGDDMLVAVVTDSPNNGSNSASSSTLAQGTHSGPSSPKPSSPSPPPVAERKPTPAENLDEALGFLRDADNTLKFVGLARLKAILDNRTELRGDPDVIAKCWAAVPATFLDRLLLAGYRSNQVVDRDYVINLAVSIIHIFLDRLPAALRDDKKFAGRVDKLLAVLGTKMYCLLETKTLIIQILAKLVATPHGSVAFLVSKGWLVLSKFAVEEPLSLLIMNLAFGAAIEVTGNTSEIQSNIHETISEWIKVFPSHSTRLFEHVHSLLGHISINQYSNVPSWLLPLTRRLLWSSTSRYDDPSHSRLVINGLSAFLMKCYPNHFPELLYGQPPSNDLTVKSKPYSWLFIQLRLIDIRSSVPSLIEGSSLAGYEATKARLTGCYDLVSAFISFLVKCSDAMSDSDEGSDKLPFNPSLVLQIREDISNVCSLTIEYLCDRFEAMRASGANGQALPGNKTTLDRLNLAATNLGPESMAEDPLVRSQLTMLSLYLREDEGEMLRKEAGRMRNAIFWLYGRAPDLRYPLIMILEQFQYNPGGLGSIGDNDGWKVLVDDLVRIVRSHAPDSTMVTCGKTIVDLMGPVVSHAIEEGKSKDEWQQFARIAIQLKAKGSRELLDLKGSVALLAIDLMTMSPHTMSKATAELRKKLVMVPSRLLTARDKMDEETHHDLDAAVENLKMRSLGIV